MAVNEIPRKDEMWFRDLYRSHYKDLLAYSCRRTNHTAAEDIVADTFLITWKKRVEIPEGNERLWLFGVARNLILNNTRASQRKKALLQKLRCQPRFDQTTSEITSNMDDQSSSELLAALNQLPPFEKELLMLICWEGLSYDEISEILYQTPNALRIRAHRARKLLAKQLEKSKGRTNDHRFRSAR